MYIPTAKDHKTAGWQPPPVWPLIALLIALFLLMLGSSCSPQKRISNLLDKHPGFALVECEERYPVIETTDTVTVQDSALLAAYEQEFAYLTTMLDSLLSAGCDTVTVERVKELVRYQPAKPCPEKVVTVTKESTAKLEVLRKQCEQTEKDLRSQLATSNKKLAKAEQERDKAVGSLDKVKKQRNRYLWWVILLTVALFRKPLWRLIRKLLIKF